MRRLLVPALIAVAGPLGGCGPTSAPSAQFEVAEVSRLRAHFAEVDRELRARDVSGLAPHQQAARAELLVWLRDYSARGRFPKNEGFADHRTPIFRDRHGTLCAMAWLIAESGHRDIVDGVAETRNLAYLPVLTDEPGLAQWLDHYGLSVAEAAAARGVLGLATGGVALLLGATRIDEGGWNRAVSLWDLALGSASAVLGSVTLLRRSGSEDRDRSPVVQVAPVTVGEGGKPALGLVARVNLP